MSSSHVCTSFRTHKSYHFLARFEFITAVNVNIVMLLCSFLRDAIYSGTSSKVPGDIVACISTLFCPKDEGSSLARKCDPYPSTRTALHPTRH